MKPLLAFLLLLYGAARAQQSHQFVPTGQGHSGIVHQMVFLKNGTQLVSVGDDGALCHWDLAKNELLQRQYVKLGNGNEGKLNALVAMEQGNVLALAGSTRGAAHSGNGFYLYNRQSDQVAFVEGHARPLTVLATHGALLASGSLDSTLRLWIVKGTDALTVWNRKMPGAITSIDFAPDGMSIAVSYGQKSFVVLEMNAQRAVVRETVVSKHFLPVRVVKYSPDSLYLVSGGDDHSLQLYNAKGRPLKKLHKTNGAVTDLAFSSDGQFLVAGTEGIGEIDGLSLPSGKLVNRYTEFDNTIHSLVFAPATSNNPYAVAATGGDHHEMRVFNALNGKTMTLLGNTQNRCAHHLQFKDKSTLAFNFDADQSRLKYEVRLDNMVLNKLIEEKSIPSTSSSSSNKQLDNVANHGIANDPVRDGRLLVTLALEKCWVQGSDFSLRSIDRSTHKVTLMQGHKGAIRSIALSPDKAWLATSAEDQLIQFWQMNNGVPDTVPTLSLFVTEAGEWVCWAREGYYTGSHKADGLLAWQNTKESAHFAKIMEASPFADVLYRPDLLVETFQTRKPIKNQLAEKQESFVDITRLVKASPPEFKIPYLAQQTGARALEETSTDVYVTDSAEVVLNIGIHYGGGGIAELNLFHNDKLVHIDKDFVFQNFQDLIVKQYPVKLLPGKNVFKVLTTNTKKMKSAPDYLTIDCRSSVMPVADLYVLAIGVDEYQNKRMNLNYGLADAKAIEKALSEKGKGIFANIYTYSLFNQQATLRNIKETIASIKAKAKIADVLVVYYAGHGIVHTPKDKEEGEFYMVLHDLTTLDDAQVAEKGLSSSQFRAWLAEINASKQLLLMDACHSEASFKQSTSAHRGLAEQQAIFQLARSSGTSIVAACGSEQTAKEFKELGHGAFTYALLEALEGKSDGGAKDKKITVNEIKAYIEDRVPQLTQQYSGTAQYPSGYSIGQDFPIGICK